MSSWPLGVATVHPTYFGVTEMKKSHIWTEAVEARCPHCGVYRYIVGVGDKGDIVECCACHKQFQLGKQR